MALTPEIYRSPGSTTTTIASVVTPISPLPSQDRSLLELDVDDDGDAYFYDLYQSPCRGVIRASNDEILDPKEIHNITNNADNDYVISYTNADGANKESDLYKTFHYYFDDLEYCGSTFYGGCQYWDLEDLKDEMDRAKEMPSIVPVSFANFTIMYDYELHYARRPADGISNDEDDNFSGRRIPVPRPQQEKPADPIPALELIETTVLEHLGAVVGLSRRGCDPNGRVSIGNPPRNYRMQHDFSEQDLDRMMAISSQPKDVLDPNHAECIVPVSSSIGSTSECLPVSGGIRIYLNTTGLEDELSLEELELSLQSDFQRLIRFGMQQDLYVSDEEENDEDVLVKYVSFIGTRIVVDGTDGEESSSGGNGNGMVASIAFIAVAFVALILSARRSNENDESQAQQ